MQNKKYDNPFLECDQWKNKARLESIERIKQHEAMKQQQKVKEAVDALYKHLLKK